MDVKFGFQVFPGQCLGCGCSDQLMKVADFGESPSGLGRRARLYLCATCCVGAASQVGDHVGMAVITQDELRSLRIDVGAASEWQRRAEAAEGKLATLAELAADL